MIASQKQLAALTAVSATAGLTGVSMADYHGRAKVYVQHTATAGAGATIVAKLQHRNGTDAWVDVENSTFETIANVAGVKEIEIDADGLKAEVRLHCTVAGSATATLGALIVGRLQYGA